MVEQDLRGVDGVVMLAVIRERNRGKRQMESTIIVAKEDWVGMEAP